MEISRLKRFEKSRLRQYCSMRHGSDYPEPRPAVPPLMMYKVNPLGPEVPSDEARSDFKDSNVLPMSPVAGVTSYKLFISSLLCRF